MEINLKSFSLVQNAGDCFSVKLAESIFPGKVNIFDRERLAKLNLIFVGSIMDWADSFTIVCGAGFIRGDEIMLEHPRQINCIRGKLSYKHLIKLGILCPPIYGDPGVLAPELFPIKANINYKIGLIPHYKDLEAPWVNLCRGVGVKIISPLLPLESYMEDLQSCEVIFSSTLHGIIFAHAYGKAALWVELTNNVIGDGFKFYDYYSSLEGKYGEPKRIKIAGDEDPYKLLKFSSDADHDNLRRNLAAATHETKEQVFNYI